MVLTLRHVPADFQIAFDKYAQDGFQLLSWTGYLVNQEDKLAAIWVKHDRGGRWQARNFLTEGEYQKKFEEALKAGQPPQQITHYLTSSGDRFAAIFETQPNLTFEARHNLTAARYQQLVNEMSAKGYRPTCISVLGTRASPRFSAIFIQDHLPWAAQHGLTQDEMNAKLKGYEQSGYDPICIAAYTDRSKVAYAAVWKQTELPEVAPMGDLPAGFEPLDTAVRDFMKEHRIPCGTLAVGSKGQLRLSRGYGYATRDRSRQVQPDDLFRIASVSKPITACLVRKLAHEGRLDLNAPAFELIGAKPLPGQQVDPRLKLITVEHLLTHQGGWVRGTTFDPMFRALEIAKELDRPAPATADDVIQYMLGQPLQFDRGCTREGFGAVFELRVLRAGPGRGEGHRTELYGRPAARTARSAGDSRHCSRADLAAVSEPAGAVLCRRQPGSQCLLASKGGAGALARWWVPPGGDGLPRRADCQCSGAGEVVRTLLVEWVRPRGE